MRRSETEPWSDNRRQTVAGADGCKEAELGRGAVTSPQTRGVFNFHPNIKELGDAGSQAGASRRSRL